MEKRNCRHFAPSSDYPIGFRFNIVALFIVLFLFDCKKLIRGCGARELGILFDFDCVFSFAIASGGETDHGGSIFGSQFQFKKLNEILFDTYNH